MGPAKLTGAPKSKIITCFPFSVKFTNISSPKSYPSHNCTFNSFAFFLIFSQSLHLHPIHLLYSTLFSFDPLLLSSFLPLSELLLQHLVPLCRHSLLLHPDLSNFPPIL